MNVVEVIRLPLTVDLSGFVQLLQRLQVPHRVIVEGEAQVLWAPETMAADVLQLYQRFPDGNADVPLAQPPVEASMPVNAPAPPSLAEQARACKVTAFILFLCLVVAGLTGLGENFTTIGWFTFLDFRVQGEYLYFTPLAQSLGDGQWWRLVSPMLLHFGVLHLAMNGLWYWELGKRIELRQGPWMLLGLTLLFSLVSNLAQHFASGPSLFGGLSGVLYGLLGHIWLYQWLAPNPLFSLPKGVLVMMLIWLVICLTGVVGQLGFGQIANAAHVGGLLIGCLTGLLGGALARRKLSV
ncbi:rhomboid family intramembrane serine protease [Pseudomonas sp. SWI6]|uniref:Rhomboid family intramembrane serine protease n=1 Tax=Pseudomonas taiwanensis TaxID=470150 RepID=A0ABR6VD33_9PSED|nr:MULTISPECIES: rhomboid family intramembrane serine protease [Pseudomonas]AGZ34301.1 rhomboid family protein [Pseudomonas sp. VLB120]AVD84150.1 rhomboid family intramembrane serine protease [Pseudomonas sp. SWI6]AVD86361.1 rhomboid family intramembrane serine protease [Pseudomonas sp. SWI44]MBC3478377.1 rhomboid family intramembrane serine protease [Pseudomonas taiwanensis]MBC3493777.1 rhomboid family intramembrane serine protease [Pseudomonas taiwanensis]